MAFPRATAQLNQDGFRPFWIGFAIAGCLLAAWTTWLLTADVSVYAVSDDARIEVALEASPVDVRMAGRVASSRLIVGRSVRSGEVLVELESALQDLHLGEERARLQALPPQLDAVLAELRAEESGRLDERSASDVSVSEARAQLEQAQAAAELAAEEEKRLAYLYKAGLIGEVESMRAATDARRRRAEANALRLSVERLPLTQRRRESDVQARVERLKRDASVLRGEIAASASKLRSLEEEVRHTRVQAPITGRLAEVMDLRPGAMVRAGDRLATIVSDGQLRAIAHLSPGEALGRVQPGQPARLRLEGFPWTQYGTIAGVVHAVAGELRDGRIRVEITLQGERSPIPVQHGLPGSVEIEVDRLSPAALVMRAAGRRLGIAARKSNLSS